MRNLLVTAFAASLFVSGVATSAPPSKAVSAAEAANLARFDAMGRKDVKAMEGLLADDLVYCHSNGLCENKQELLATFAAMTNATKVSNSAVRARQLGEVVIIHGDVSYPAQGADAPQRKMNYTSVWVERNGSWQMTAMQATRIP
jgi:ketosteroid isomerase-like protein